MGINLKLGEKIPLFLTLESKETGKFVRVTIYDETGTQVGAVVSVAHLSEGSYFDDSRTMPSAQNIIAVYDIFNDAGFTTLSINDKPTNERFDFQKAIVTRPADIIGIVTSAELIGETENG